eukprot:5017859-Prorocentrum_lima.AAC.1
MEITNNPETHISPVHSSIKQELAGMGLSVSFDHTQERELSTQPSTPGRQSATFRCLWQMQER